MSTLKKKKQIKYKNFIQEMKNRLEYIIFSFFCAFFTAYYKALQLTYIFLLSFQDNKDSEIEFIFTDLHEAFSSTFYICLMGAFLFTLPFLGYQCLSYCSPAWHKHECRYKSMNAQFFFFFWIFFIYLVHFFFLPQLSSFLLKFQVFNTCLTITVEAKILSYLYWCFGLLFIASLFFFLLFILFCIISRNISGWRSQPETSKNFKNYRKISFWGFLLTLSIISPPEFVSQFLLFLLFFGIFEIFLWLLLVRDQFTFFRK